MRLDNFKFFMGAVSMVSFISMVGCASQAPVKAPSESVAQTNAAPEDNSNPSIPISSKTIIPPAAKAPEPPAPAKPGSVASVVEKMNKNPFTLYWREKDSYTYHIGSRLDAEYKPGEGLTVKALKESPPIICEFDSNGELVNANKAAGAGNQCSELMFTLDEELGE